MNLIQAFWFALDKAWISFSGLWPLLLLSILVSVTLKLYVDQDRVAAFLKRNQRNSVVMSTGLAVATPFCSCGTTAVVLGMMASTIPWAPIVAFMVASPLTSPQELVFSAGLFGWRFALTFFAASVVLGLAGGFAALGLESAGMLNDQSRVRQAPAASDEEAAARPRVTARLFVKELGRVAWNLGLLFTAFSFIGYLLNGMVPASWIAALFGPGRLHSVPLAATLGIPFFFSTEASLPLLRPMLDAGMSPGAALAFLITGAGTSIGAIVGALTIARWRIVALVVGTLWLGGIVFGYGYDALSALLG
jgi:uncharacterized membrane protein YraQ (UPF0718 family)